MPASAPPTAPLLRDAALAELTAVLLGPASQPALEYARQLATESDAPGVNALAEILEHLDVSTWDSQRIAAFSAGTSVDCPTYETAYFATEAHRQPHRMADLAGLYRAFGVEPAPGTGRPDEASVELEFLAFMLRKEAQALLHGGAPRVRQVQHGLRIFLREHIGRWLPLFADRTRERAADTFFPAVLEFAESLVTAQARRLGVTAIEPAPGFDPTAWAMPRSHGPEFGVEAFIALESISPGGAP